MTDRTTNNNVSGSFYNLLNKELGVTSGQTAATNIVQLPLAFVRSGWVNIGNGYTNNVGERGYGWARTSNSSTYAYSLYFNTAYVRPSNSNDRYSGFPLRCLYPGSA